MNKQLFEEGQRLEKAGDLEDAAVAYQRVFDADRGNEDVVGRLLVVYRRLKEYRKELQVIEAALGAVAQRDKAAREKWISEHPGAAKLGKEVLRTLGGESLTAYGTDPLVEKLLKRKGVLEKKIGGGRSAGRKKKVARGKEKKVARGKEKKAARGKEKKIAQEKEKKTQARKARARQQEERAREKEAQARERQKEKAARQAARQAEKQAAAEAKRKQAEAKRAAAEAKKAAAAAKKAAAEARAHPSLFVVSLRYLVPLDRIDAAMKKHVAFLDKHFASGDFLVSGRQEPRTGGIIIARGKDRSAVQRIMNQDPFVKGKLASVDIVEFVASKTGKGLDRWVRGING